MSHPEAIAGETRLILAVTSASPRSNRARANLASFLEKHNDLDMVPEEMDLLSRPETILELGVFASPALVHQGRDGEIYILYGDMSDTSALEGFLRGCLTSS